jgi:hypothetical protein
MADENDSDWSRRVASCVVSTLVAAKIPADIDYDRAHAIVAEEILVRLAIGDRPDSKNFRYNSNWDTTGKPHAHGRALYRLVQLRPHPQDAADVAGDGGRDFRSALVDGRRGCADRRAEARYGRHASWIRELAR